MSDNEYRKIHASEDTKLAVKLGVDLFGKKFTGAAEKNGEYLDISVYSDSKLNVREFISAAAEGFGSELYIPEAFNVIIERLRVDYIKNVLSFECDFDAFLRKIKFSLASKSKDYFLGFTAGDINMTEIPFISEFAKDAEFALKALSVIFCTSDTEYEPAEDGAEKERFEAKAGLSICGNICGFKFEQLLTPYEKKNREAYADNSSLLSENGGAKIFWADINKKVSILTLHRAGFSYDKGELGVMLDVSASLNPFSVSLLGAGLTLNTDTMHVGFLLSGLGMEFDNGFLTIGGAFSKSGEKYSGALTVGVKAFKITLAGIYEKGRFLAYALINANIGGPPVFFVTGIAAAFGYNKRIVLPDIKDVADFPLVAAATGKNKMTLAEMIGKLDNPKYIADHEGDKFVSAGIKFTTFNMMESFVLLSVGFGGSLCFSLLGTSDISVPPMTDKSPIAFARLALKAVLDPSEGVFSLQAQLTSESYILSSDCKLTGGFAFFLWFGSNAHSGDFVLSLGGYHPDYKKPSHYPAVPRIGINWQITKQLSVSGEAYFALAPSCIMAGVRMSALYKDGNLKAWFIAQVDFMIQWKPFEYSARLCVSLGASYTVDLWFIHHTFTIELGVDISFHGPEFSGSARISWFIISFTIKFGDQSSSPPPPLTYGEFSESFLPASNPNKTVKAALSSDSEKAEPLSVVIGGKVYGEKNGVKYVQADGLSFLVSSAIPLSDGEVVIRPMGDKPFNSRIDFIADGIEEYEKTDYVQNVPTAMWGGSGELRSVKSGYVITVGEPVFELFPKTRFISLEELRKKNTRIYEAYAFGQPIKLSCTDDGTIKVFRETINTAGEKRRAFMEKMGIKPAKDISLTLFAKNAEMLFDENILIKKQADL